MPHGTNTQKERKQDFIHLKVNHICQRRRKDFCAEKKNLLKGLPAKSIRTKSGLRNKAMRDPEKTTET